MRDRKLYRFNKSIREREEEGKREREREREGLRHTQKQINANI